MALRKAQTTDAAPKVNEQAQDAQEQEAQAQESTVETVAEQRQEEAQVEDSTVVAEQQPEPEAELEQGADAAEDAQVETVQAEQVQEAKADRVTSAEGTSTTAQEVQPEPKQAVAVKGTSDVPAMAGAAARGGALAAFTNDMAEHGFEGLNVTGMSFDRIKLHEGRFKLGTDEKDLGETFDCIIQGTRPIYIVRQYDGDDSPVYFSYQPDGDVLTSGESAAEIQAEWIEQGYPREEWDIKRYIEAMVTLVNREDEYEQHMASLSIPPASTDRLGGAAAAGWQKYRLRPDALITRCKVGPSIKKGNTTWRPWLFSIVGKAPVEA